MKTFTRIFTLIFALGFLISLNVNGQNWYDDATTVDGSGQSWEIWIYGGTIGGNAIKVNDVIGIFDGPTLVGKLKFTVAPSEQTWTSCRLMAYTEDDSGNTLFTPGNPIWFKAWDGTNEYYSIVDLPLDVNTYDYTFHPTWWSPYPAMTNYPVPSSFLYDMKFPTEQTYTYLSIDFDVATQGANPTTYSISGIVDTTGAAGGINGITVNIGGNSVLTTTNGAGGTLPGEYKLENLLAGGNYTLTASYTGFVTSYLYFTNLSADLTNQDITLVDGRTYSGIVYHTAVAGGNELGGVKVLATIDGTVYETYSDTNAATLGEYEIDELPSGSFDFAFSKDGYDAETVTVNLSAGNVTNGQPVLQVSKADFSGYVYDAETGLPLENVVVKYNIGAADEDIGNTNADGYYEGDATGSTTAANLTFTLNNYNTETESLIAGPGSNTSHNEYMVSTTWDTTLAVNWMPGDPTTEWNIHFLSAKIGSLNLVKYDEIAVYTDDGSGGPDVLVGHLLLQQTPEWYNADENVLKAYGTLWGGGAGFVKDEDYVFQVYDLSTQTTILYDSIHLTFETGSGLFSGDEFPDPTVGATSYLHLYADPYQEGSISGTVTATTGGAAIVGATIEFENFYSGSSLTSVTTIAGGEYTKTPVDLGTYYVTASAPGYASKRQTVTVEGPMTVDFTLDDPPTRKFTVRIPAMGWKYISRNIAETTITELEITKDGGAFLAAALPASESMDDLLGAIVEDNTSGLIWVRNDGGDQMVYDGGGIAGGATYDVADGIGNWEQEEGYLVFNGTASYYDVSITGSLIDSAANTIAFTAGGGYTFPTNQFIPYWLNTDKDAKDALYSIIDQNLWPTNDKMLWAKDADGNQLHNPFGTWVNNIGDLSPGDGLQIRLLGEATLNYSDAVIPPLKNLDGTDATFFTFDGGDARKYVYTIYLKSGLTYLDEVAIYDNGKMVGMAVIDSEEEWEVAIPCFSELNITSGYTPGNNIQVAIFDYSEGAVIPPDEVTFEMVQVNNKAYMGTTFPGGEAHASYMEITTLVGVGELALDYVKMYPNPATSTVNIQTPYTIEHIRVFNIQGMLVKEMVGTSEFESFSVADLDKGIYLVQVLTEKGMETKRLAIQ